MLASALLPPASSPRIFGIMWLQEGKRLNTASVPSNDLRAKTSRSPKTALTPFPTWLAARPSPVRDLGLFIICNTLSLSALDVCSLGIFTVPEVLSFCNLNK